MQCLRTAELPGLTWLVDPAWSSQNLSCLLVNINKVTLNFMWKYTGPWRTRTTLKRDDKVGEFMLLGFKSFYKDTAIKTLWYCQEMECRARDPWVMADCHGDTRVFSKWTGNACPRAKERNPPYYSKNVQQEVLKLQNYQGKYNYKCLLPWTKW